jgi:hypothetical protein
LRTFAWIEEGEPLLAAPKPVGLCVDVSINRAPDPISTPSLLRSGPVRCRGLWLYQRRSSRIRTAQEPRKKKARPAASKCYWVRLYRVQSYGGLPSFEQYQSSKGDWVICERDMFPEHALAPLHSAPLAPCSCWRYARREPAWTTTVVAADPAACRYGTIHTFASIVSCQPQLGASPSSRHFRR